MILFPKQGDRRLTAEWLVEIGGDEINGVDPDKCKYHHAMPADNRLDTALRIANAKDLNGEGTVIEEEYSGECWIVVERYNCYGKRTFNG